MFKGIFKIPPGYYHDSEKGLIQYWAPPPVDRFYAPEADSVRAAVEESVRRQLVSDVEIGSFLSGGLDTSTIVAFASKYYNGRLKTFCMGFGHEYDEIEDAKMVADHFGTEHHSLVINDKDTLKLYPRMIWHSEQPKLNTYGWFVNEYASKYVKVCLSGLGGDELFFGYPTSTRFMNFQKAQRLMKFPGVSIFGAFMGGKRGQTLSGIRKRAQTYLSIISPIYGSEDHRFFSLPEKDVLGCHESLTKRVEDQFFKSRLEFVQQAVNAEFFTKMPDDYLTIDDSMSMAHSLENRVPLLDNQLLDLMLPVGYRRNYLGGVGKALLRQAMGPILPQKCLEKPKQGFSPDILHWWKGEMGDEVRRKLPDSPAVKQYFAMEKITEMMSHADNSYSKASLAFHIYAFHIWHDLFIDRGKENADVLVLPLH
jgi:asparagine synthase (glutamine-hydrolysing)